MARSLKPTIYAGIVLSLVLVAPSLRHGASGTESERAMEVIGAVLNSGPSSVQYGYITFVSGIPDIFGGNPQNETTALLTFFSDTTTVRVVNNGPLRIVNREGVMTVYSNEKPKGDFGNPSSFRDGVPVMTATLRHQVILDTGTNQFTTVFVNTIKSATGFKVGGNQYSLGKPGQTFKMTVFGRPSTTGPGQFVIAGYSEGLR